MKTYFTVAAVIKNKGSILILKKSDDDYNYPGKWSFCSGYVKEFESAEDSILREIKEETGLKAKIIKNGKILLIKDKIKKKNWIVMNFLCEAKSLQVNLDHENSEFKWINPKDIKKYPAVPGLKKNLKALGLL